MANAKKFIAKANKYMQENHPNINDEIQIENLDSSSGEKPTKNTIQWIYYENQLNELNKLKKKSIRKKTINQTFKQSLKEFILKKQLEIKQKNEDLQCFSQWYLKKV